MAQRRPSSSFMLGPDVDGFRTVLVNYYFVVLGLRDWVLVDAGLPGSGRRLVREAMRRFGPDVPPRAILLTHGHFDHVGALAWLQRRWPDVPVYAHPDEAPYLTESESYPRADPTVGGGLLSMLSVLYPRRMGPFTNVIPLPADGSVPELPEWQWISTPGHSRGHVSFWRERDRTLIAGDAVTNTRQESLSAVLRQAREVRPPPAYFTPDWQGAYDSLLRIRALRPSVVGSGHGVPAAGAYFHQGLERLVREFPERGLPRRGHYVAHSWSGIPLPAHGRMLKS